MVQVLKIPNKPMSAGEHYARALETGLSSGLNALAQSKMNQLARRQFGSQLQGAFPNITPQGLELLQTFQNQPELLKPLLENIGQLQQQPITAAGEENNQLKNIEGQFNASQIGQPSPFKSAAARKMDQQLALAERKDIRQEEAAQENRSKNVREYLEPFNKRYESAKANIRDYNTLISIAKRGKLRAGNTAQILSKLGLEDFNRNYDTQIANKLTGRLAQNVGGVFGTNARITNYLESVFQRSLPTLWNTPEGIIAISEINKLADEGEVIKQNARRSIIKENNNRIPPDIDELIEQRVKPELDSIESETIKIAEGAVNNKRQSRKTFDILPEASLYPGKKIRDTTTGQIVESDGREWIPVENNNGI